MPSQFTLEKTAYNKNCLIYKITPSFGKTDAYIATTPYTRAICNDPKVCGITYTNLLKKACTEILSLMPIEGVTEADAMVANILRGGLNFGLRDALADAYGWNHHTTCFLSAQRAQSLVDGTWHITENSYKKLYFPCATSLYIGDVVATGTSLEYGLNELVDAAIEHKTNLRNIYFFTFGGIKTEEIFQRLDERCRNTFQNYGRTIIIYLEGRFTVPEETTPLTIRLPGTDLVRWGSLMAPEFVESQYEQASYPIERCIIYDAGSRAFWLNEYAADVMGYWKQLLDFAEKGLSFKSLLEERFPELDTSRFGEQNLREMALTQIKAMDKILNRQKGII